MNQKMPHSSPNPKTPEPSVQSHLMSSKQKEVAAAVSSYIGFPERLMQKAGFYKHPFLYVQLPYLTVSIDVP
ncbi:uncharacterized protein P174DRAFT_439095 [Aspergillus novofumigatus IBT 16806]|uniref:Uncharacterized protein n=1 Tax=Aspergillus novofumigatus (strain IBT 16806) TaxID=1392255 RepID=A0A2I1CI74_ASPN1|nr:uncharacterized protein P174DRAFT_439095 [Aspergillus novofumigatus IBT 16806]PKX97310.1 hypothetical protein P174DRAFT_439095 [Aspergillus novofumigatus IBT 16806]